MTITRRGFLAVLAGAAVTLSLGPPRRPRAAAPATRTVGDGQVIHATITLANEPDGWRVLERPDAEIERGLAPLGNVFRLPASVWITYPNGVAHLDGVPTTMARHADAAWRLFGMVWLASRGDRHWLIVRPVLAQTDRLIADRACTEHANAVAGCGLLEVGGITIEEVTS